MRVAKLTEVRKIEVVEGEKPEISSEYDEIGRAHV